MFCDSLGVPNFGTWSDNDGAPTLEVFLCPDSLPRSPRLESTLNTQHSTLNTQPSTLNPQPDLPLRQQHHHPGEHGPHHLLLCISLSLILSFSLPPSLSLSLILSLDRSESRSRALSHTHFLWFALSVARALSLFHSLTHTLSLSPPGPHHLLRRPQPRGSSELPRRAHLGRRAALCHPRRGSHLPRDGPPRGPARKGRAGGGGAPKPSTLNPQPSTVNPQPSTLNPQPSTLNPQPLTLNPQPSTLNPQVEEPAFVTKDIRRSSPFAGTLNEVLNPSP